MALILDRSGTASVPDAATLTSWAGDQRVFISSVMSEFAALRQRLAAAIREMGAQPVWFEDFGGRDDDAEVAYLGEVASSTIYLGILGRHYGRLDKTTRLSATHAEYREAEKLGLPVSVWVLEEDEMHADQYDFLQEVRTFHTTGSFDGAEDLLARVRRPFEEMAAETVSPWVKLDEVVMRARTVVDSGVTITVRASVHSGDVLAALEAMRPDRFRPHDVRLTWAGKSVPVRVSQVETTTNASRSSEVKVTLEHIDSRGSAHPFSAGTSLTTANGRTFTSDDLAIIDVRHELFHEEKAPGIYGFGGSMRDFTEDLPAQDLPTAQYQAVFSLLLTEALVESGRAQRVDLAQVSPLGPDGRHVKLSWTSSTPGGDRPTPVIVQGVMPRH